MEKLLDDVGASLEVCLASPSLSGQLLRLQTGNQVEVLQAARRDALTAQPYRFHATNSTTRRTSHVRLRLSPVIAVALGFLAGKQKVLSRFSRYMTMYLVKRENVADPISSDNSPRNLLRLQDLSLTRRKPWWPGHRKTEVKSAGWEPNTIAGRISQ
jgi:hypothetical protein